VQLLLILRLLTGRAWSDHYKCDGIRSLSSQKIDRLLSKLGSELSIESHDLLAVVIEVVSSIETVGVGFESIDFALIHIMIREISMHRCGLASIQERRRCES
jgi:hypothetical protein